MAPCVRCEFQKIHRVSQPATILKKRVGDDLGRLVLYPRLPVGTGSDL
jgi:hypothetical protein